MHELKTYRSETLDEKDPYFIMLYLKSLEICAPNITNTIYVDEDTIIETELVTRYLTNYLNKDIPPMETTICEGSKFKRLNKLISNPEFVEKIRNYFYYVLEWQNANNMFQNNGFFVDIRDDIIEIIFDVDNNQIKAKLEIAPPVVQQEPDARVLSGQEELGSWVQDMEL